MEQLSWRHLGAGALLVWTAATTSALGQTAGASSDGQSNSVQWSSTFHVTPAADGQQYVRCGTLGTERVKEVALSSDQRFLAVRTSTGTVRLIAIEGMREVAVLAPALGSIEAIAFSPDGATLAALVPEMGQVALWRTADGSLLSTFAGPPMPLIDFQKASLAFSDNGKRLVTGMHTVIDLATGQSRAISGERIDTTLRVNPQNLDPGGSTPLVRFVDGGLQVLEILEYGVGNSPTTSRISLVNQVTFQTRIIYGEYRDYLDGFAISPDGQSFAIAGHPGASFTGMVAHRGGLGVYRLNSEVPVTQLQSFTGKLLSYAPDSNRLFALTGDALVSLDAGNLSVLTRVPVPTGTRVLTISPDGSSVITTDGSTTTWRDTATFAARRSFAGVLDGFAWSGTFGKVLGAAIGKDGAAYVFREHDASEVGRVSLPETALPEIASLGGAATADGTRAITNPFLLHGRATNWYHYQIVDKSSGAPVRVFGPAAGPVVISDDGEKAYSGAVSGPGYAVWCR